MASDIDVRLIGLEPVLRKLENLGPALRKKSLRSAMSKAASTVRKAATAKAPRDTGAMSKNIRVQYASRTSKKVGGVAFRVGVRGGAQQQGAQVRYARSKKGRKSTSAVGSSTWYWRLVEFGTQKMAARPFMRPALSNNVNKITSQITSDLDAAITKFSKTEQA